MSPLTPPPDWHARYDSRRPVATLFRLADMPWWRYAALVALFCLKHAPLLLLPVALGYIVDQLGRSRFVFAEWWFVALVAAVLLQNVPSHLAFTRLLSHALRRIEFRLRALLTERLQQLSIAFHDNAESGRIQSKVLRDVESIYAMCQAVAHTVLIAGVTWLFAMTSTLVKAPVVAVFFAASVPLALWFGRTFRRPLAARQHEFRAGVEAMSARVAQMVEMIPVTRAHGVEDREMAAVSQQLDTVLLQGRQLDTANGLFQASLWVGVTAISLTATAFAGYLSWRGRISIGDVVMYSAFYQMLLGSVQALLGTVPTVTQGLEAFRSINEILERDDLERNAGKAPVTRVDGALVFERVSFLYPGSRTPAVDEISLSISPGECIAFVGESGSGKSTLMRLAIGLARPTRGRLLLDGRDMNTLDLRGYRRFIAVVSQRTVLMAGTIRANLTYGLDDMHEEALRQALAAANALEFVEQLPQGLDTLIGERGARLSGGEAQRLAMARALIRDPRLIILDEATSALDLRNESLIQEATHRLMANRTTLIVAHRLSTIRRATRVVVMQQGRCIESGTPGELLARDGVFRRLHLLHGEPTPTAAVDVLQVIADRMGADAER